MEVKAMTVRAWADTNLQRGYNLNSDKLKSFASAIDDELGKAGSGATIPTFFGSTRLTYECEQSIVFPGGNFLMSLMYNSRGFVQNKTLGVAPTAWQDLSQYAKRFRIEPYNDAYTESGTMPYFVAYQSCSDGGYNIFHIVKTSSERFIPKLFKLNKKYDGVGELVQLSQIDGIFGFINNRKPESFQIIGGEPLDGLTLNRITLRNGNINYRTGIFGNDRIETTLYTSKVVDNLQHNDSGKLFELFIDVEINGGMEYGPNPHKLRRYTLEFKTGYLRITQLGETQKPQTEVYHIHYVTDS